MKPVDRASAERAISAFLEALGYDTSNATLAETPARVAEAFADELLAGERQDPADIVLRGSEPLAAGNHGLVVVRDVPVTTVCPHHLLPALGHATVGYLPGSRLLGIGTVARLADACARRLTLQEAIGERVVATLIEHAGAAGAFCRLELLHTCLSTRGAVKPDTALVTLAHGGALSGPEGTALLALAIGSRNAP